MTGPQPVCLECKHLDRNNFDGVTCNAFPEGIPEEILVLGNKHSKPLPEQDNDIVFEPIENVIHT